MIASDQQAPIEAPTVEAPPSTGPPAEPLTKDQIFHLLQNERRRLTLQYLRDREGRIKMRDIAEQVAAWEHETTVQALSSDQRQRVYIPLYQNHLPKLDAEGVIEYDQSRGVVERTAAADQLDPFLVEDEGTEDPPCAPEATPTSPWPTYYLATSACSALVLGAAVAGIPGISALSTPLLAFLVVLAFSAVTLAHMAASPTGAA